MSIILETFNVQIDSSKYQILIGEDLLASVGKIIREKTLDNKIIVVSDEFFKDIVDNVLIPTLQKSGFSVFPHFLPGGKTNKNISGIIKIYNVLEANDFARDSTLIALGGGVIGDMAGFIAATYLRGINLIHIPTTLTAMIDSSIGGKTAINFRKTINAIGTYYHPMVNLIDLQFLNDLSDRDFKAGLAEIVKCAIIDDADLFKYLNENHDKIVQKDKKYMLKVMKDAIRIKLEHVGGDVREQGKRLILNYGHTMGHAIETSTGTFTEIYRHGEGVSLGMVGAAHIATNYFKLSNDLLHQHEGILSKYELPISIKAADIGFKKNQLKEECMRNLQKDKKRKDNHLRFILPSAIGDCRIVNDVDIKLVDKAFDYLLDER